ncbi:MAG TPA: SRPBCC domain-containing protein [Acidimicrobiia bacterium]
MTTYSVTRAIKAPAQTIRDLLSNADSYPEWNKSVLAIEGQIAEGEKIKLISIANPDRQFKLNVTEVDAPNSMVWWEGMPLGLFKGVRTFKLTPRDGGTEFSMEEVYSGLMAPMITKSIPDMTESFDLFADGLKAEAEKRAG